MLSLKQTPYYKDVLKEINYEFGDVFIFNGFFVSEIKEGVTFSWENHALHMINDLQEFTKSNGSDLIYLSHRIHSYSVVPTDWLKFVKSDFSLKGYGIISYSETGLVNTLIENLFFKKTIRRFTSIQTAVNWAKQFDLVETEK